MNNDKVGLPIVTRFRHIFQSFVFSLLQHEKDYRYYKTARTYFNIIKDRKKYGDSALLNIAIVQEVVEVGCGELKPFGKTKELVEMDEARIGEVCKRQLHVRMRKSKSVREHETFGILLAGESELTKLKFNNGEYEYSVLKTVKLFSRDTYYKDIEIALEALASFKNLIDETWKGELDNWFEENLEKLKPTARFLNPKEKKKTQ